MNVCFCKQETAYEVRISDWSSDVCSSDLRLGVGRLDRLLDVVLGEPELGQDEGRRLLQHHHPAQRKGCILGGERVAGMELHALAHGEGVRSEEHTSELQSLMRNSYAVVSLNNITRTTI